MINSGSLPVKLEMSNFSYQKVGAILLSAFLILIIIGAAGPVVFLKTSYDNQQLSFDGSGSTTYNALFDEMVELNRVIWVNMKLTRDSSTSGTSYLSEDIDLTINVVGQDGLRGTNSKLLIEDIVETKRLTFDTGKLESDHIFMYQYKTISYGKCVCVFVCVCCGDCYDDYNFTYYYYTHFYHCCYDNR